MKRIKITDDFKKTLYKDFKKYLETLEPGKKVEYSYKEEISTENKPKVIISNTAYNKILTLVSKADGEVGWNGSVTRNGNIFTVEDIFVYPQTVTGATVTCDELETAQWLMSLPTETFNKLRFQAHSHVNMGISPSGVDTTMYEKYLNNLGDEDFYIFMIFNKRHEYYIEINDNKTNIIYYKNDVDVVFGEEENFWESVKDNIRKPVATPAVKPSEDKVTQFPNKVNSDTTDFSKCNNTTCKDCEKFTECAKDWYNKKIKELAN